MLRSDDNQDVFDSRFDQGIKRIKDHLFIVNRQKLFTGGGGHRK